jgi:hypothetical protein
MTRRASIPWIVVILFVALTSATTAVAAPTVAKAITKGKVKKIATAQANKAIDTRASTLSVGKAATADQATIGLSPVAYAVVNADGSIVTSSSRGVTQAMVVRRLSDAYCFTVPFAFKTVQTTPMYVGGGAADVTASTAVRGSYGNPGDCLLSEQLEVCTTVNGAFAAYGFTIWFYN